MSGLSERHKWATPEESHQSRTRTANWTSGLNCLDGILGACRPRTASGNRDEKWVAAHHMPTYPLVEPNALYEHALHRERIPDFSMRISSSCSSVFPEGSGSCFTENTAATSGLTVRCCIIRRIASETLRRAPLRRTAVGATFTGTVTLYRIAEEGLLRCARIERCAEEVGRTVRKIAANARTPRILFFAGIAIRGTENRPDGVPGRFLYGKLRPSSAPSSCDYFSS